MYAEVPDTTLETPHRLRTKTINAQLMRKIYISLCKRKSFFFKGLLQSWYITSTVVPQYIWSPRISCLHERLMIKS